MKNIITKVSTIRRALAGPCCARELVPFVDVQNVTSANSATMAIGSAADPTITSVCVPG